MSLKNYLENFTLQKLSYYNNPTDLEKINSVESALYATFQRKDRLLKAINKDQMPKEVFDVKLKWLSNDGSVEIHSGPISRVRNFSAKKNVPGNVSGKFAVGKNAFGRGRSGDLFLKENETVVLNTNTVHEYQNVTLSKGAKIVVKGDGNRFVLLVKNKLFMDQRSRIEWIGLDGKDTTKGESPNLNGVAVKSVFENYNGHYSFLEKLEIKNGESGRGLNPGVGGQSVGSIYIEAYEMEMKDTSAIRAMGGNGGSSSNGHGAGGNGGAIVLRISRAINVKKSMLSVTAGKSQGEDGKDGLKDIEILN